MKILQKISEDEMILIFLKAEFQSDRFSKSINEALKELAVDSCIITEAKLGDQSENKIRRRLLTLHRHYEERTELFDGFPRDVEWYRVSILKEELSQVRYMDYSYWNELTGGSRLPQDAVKNIRINNIPYGKNNAKYLEAVKALKEGGIFPELILVAESKEGPYVVLEGHLRLSSYALAPEYIPDSLTVILGLSPHMTAWSGW